MPFFFFFFNSFPKYSTQELAAFTSTVVATGGGVVKKLQNWGYMTQAITIYLEGEPELLTARVLKDGVENRPLLARKEVRPPQSHVPPLCISGAYMGAQLTCEGALDQFPHKEESDKLRCH